MSAVEGGAAVDVFQLVCNSSAAAVDAYLAGAEGSVDVANDKGDTPLIMAARRGDIAVVQSLVAAGASVHTRNLKGSNPLIAVSTRNAARRSAAQQTEHRARQWAVTEQLSPSTACLSERVLCQAAMKGHTDICRLFLQLGADVNQSTDSSDTALSLAIWQNHTAVCLLLIDQGADVDNVDKFGDTMLLDAAKHGNVAVMTRLLEKQHISVNHASATKHHTLAATHTPHHTTRRRVQYVRYAECVCLLPARASCPVPVPATRRATRPSSALRGRASWRLCSYSSTGARM